MSGFLTPPETPPTIVAIQREYRSLKGWRARQIDSLQLLAELQQLKGAQHYRRRIEELRREIALGLTSNDVEVMRNSTNCADMAVALAEAEKALPGKAWLFGRGRCRPGEPLYGFAVFESRSTMADDEPLVITEHEDPRQCVMLAVDRLRRLGALA